MHNSVVNLHTENSTCFLGECQTINVRHKSHTHTQISSVQHEYFMHFELLKRNALYLMDSSVGTIPPRSSHIPI